MIENLDILYNVTGQSLYFDAPEGRPSSITSSQVFESTDSDDATAESALDGSASVETNPSTTFDASSGDAQRNPRQLQLAATTGISVGRRYRTENAYGEWEIVEVREVRSGESVLTRSPLKNDYESGDTFETTRITHGIDATWVADKNNISSPRPSPRYRWRLEYVVDGSTYVHFIGFDLVRYSGTTTVTGLDVDAAYPWLGWLDRLPADDREDRGDRIIGEAYRQVKLEMAQAGKADEAARNREVTEDLVIHRAAEIVAGRDLDAVEVIRSKYTERFANFVTTAKDALPFDGDGSGAARPSTHSQVWRR